MAQAALKVLSGMGQAASLMNATRLRVLQSLHEPDSASGVARRLRLPRQKVNYHLRELEKNRLVEFVREQRKGNCVERVVRASATAYVINPAVLGPIGAEPERLRDRFSASYLIAVAARAIRELASLMPRAVKAGKTLATLTLQADIRFARADDLIGFTNELANALARLTAKYHSDDPKGRVFRCFVGSYPAITRPEILEDSQPVEESHGTDDATDDRPQG